MEPMNEAICAPSFSNLYEYVKEEYNTGRCYPPRYQIFNAYNLTPINNIKVVILGQDPYIQPKQAHGLCFSVCSKKRYVPKTLIELFRNLERNDEIDFKFPDPLHGDLTNWAK